MPESFVEYVSLEDLDLRLPFLPESLHGLNGLSEDDVTRPRTLSGANRSKLGDTNKNASHNNMRKDANRLIKYWVSPLRTGYLPRFFSSSLSSLLRLAYNVAAKTRRHVPTFAYSIQRIFRFPVLPSKVQYHRTVIWSLPSISHQLSVSSICSAVLLLKAPPTNPPTHQLVTHGPPSNPASATHPKKTNSTPLSVSHPIHQFPHIIVQTSKMVQPRMVSHIPTRPPAWVRNAVANIKHQPSHQAPRIPPSSQDAD